MSKGSPFLGGAVPLGESGPQGRKGCGLSVPLLIGEMRIPEYGLHQISMLLCAAAPSVSCADSFPKGDVYIDAYI